MKTAVNNYKFESIGSKLSKSFGSIKKGNESDFIDCLMPMEYNLLKANRHCGVNNGRRVIEALRVCMLITDGRFNQLEYDLDKYITKDNSGYIQALLLTYDPFTNKKIHKIFMRKYDINSIDDLKAFYTVPIKCLVRLEKSVDFWTAERGPEGYFNFLEAQTGKAVKPNNDWAFWGGPI
ncbi:MAG: hypothetical protein LBS62_02920 [Clostridiales bacterium]|nr:hypothetical protein [Clostridiales bacterium]